MANQLKLVATISPANTAVEASTDNGATWKAVAMSTVGSQQEGLLINVAAGTYAGGTVQLRAVAFPAVLVSEPLARTVLGPATSTAMLSPTVADFSHNAAPQPGDQAPSMALAVLDTDVTGATSVAITITGTASNASNTGVSVSFDGVFLVYLQASGSVALPAYSGTKRLSINMGHAEGTGFSAMSGQRVTQLVFTNGTAAIVAPVRPAEVVVYLADSISTGYGSGNPGRYATPVLLRTATRGTTQLGYSGIELQKMLDPGRRVNLLAQIKSAFGTTTLYKKIWFQLGINDFNNNSGTNNCTPAMAKDLVNSLLNDLAADVFFKDLKVFLASPTVTSNQATANALGFTLAQYRTAIAEAAVGRDFVMTVDGTQEVSSTYWSDGTHFTSVGFALKADYDRVLLNGTFAGNFATASGSSSGFRTAIVNSSPAYYWPLNTNGSSQPATVGATALSLNNTGASGQASPLTTDVSAQSAGFDGVDDYGSVQLDLSTVNKIGVGFWLYTDNQAENNYNSALSFGTGFAQGATGAFVLSPHVTDGNGNRNFFVGVISNLTGAYPLPISSSHRSDTGFPIQANGWHYYGLSIDVNGLLSATVDGVVQAFRGARTTGATNFFGNQLLQLARFAGGGNYLKMKMQDLAIWTGANVPTDSAFANLYAARTSAAAPSPPPAGFAGIYNANLNHRDTRLVFNGVWTTDDGNTGYGSVGGKYSTESVATVNLTQQWYGNQIVFNTGKNPKGATVQLLVDGVVVHQYSQNSGTGGYIVPAAITIPVPLGTHDFVLRNISADGAYMWFGDVGFYSV